MDAWYALLAIFVHNSIDQGAIETGSETLEPGVLVIFRGELYLSFGSGGGRVDGWFCRFVRDHLPEWRAGEFGKVFVPSGCKPDGWFVEDNANIVKDTSPANLRRLFPDMSDGTIDAVQLWSRWSAADDLRYTDPSQGIPALRDAEAEVVAALERRGLRPPNAILPFLKYPPYTPRAVPSQAELEVMDARERLRMYAQKVEYWSGGCFSIGYRPFMSNLVYNMAPGSPQTKLAIHLVRGMDELVEKTKTTGTIPYPPVTDEVLASPRKLVDLVRGWGEPFDHVAAFITDLIIDRKEETAAQLVREIDGAVREVSRVDT